MTAAPLTVAVVSWNTRELLVRCLNSLEAAARAGEAEVWVVDNASTDGSPDAVRSHAPWAQLIEPGTNLGFGRAVNRVAAATGSEWLLAANADVAVLPGALGAMLRSGSDSRVGCVAPRLLLPDGTTQHSVYPFPTVPFALAFNLGLYRLSSRLAGRLCLEGAWNADRPREVGWAIGACLLLRRAAFDAVGGFDERQWMYAEDLDLGWRLAEHGWTTRYEPAARVLHESGAATRSAFGEQRAIRFMTATYAMLARRRGRAKALATAALNIVGAASRLAWMAPLAATRRRWRAPAAENRRWLTTHLRAFRAAFTLPGSP